MPSTTPLLPWGCLLVAFGFALTSCRSIEVTARRIRRGSDLLQVVGAKHVLMALTAQFGLGAILLAILALREPQSLKIPEIGFLGTGSSEATINLVLAFRQGLSQAGFVEGQNVKIEYRWANNEYDRLPKLLEDFIRRQVAVIATPLVRRRQRWRSVQTRQFRSSSASPATRLNLVSSPA